MNSSKSAKIKLSLGHCKSAQAWCEKNISPRQYWLHNQFGGEGWKIYSTYSDGFWYLETEDPSYISWIQLTLD